MVLGIPDEPPFISLPSGNTKVHFNLESINPAGSVSFHCAGRERKSAIYALFRSLWAKFDASDSFLGKDSMYNALFSSLWAKLDHIWCLLQFLGKIQFWNLNGSLSPYQCILVEVTIRSIHGLHHEFVTILLVRVELEGLQTHWNAWLWKLKVMILWWWYRADKLIVVRKLPEIWTVCLGSIKPEFGLTQYRFGAVVLILKQTLRSDGFVRRIEDETWLVKGPERWFKKPKYAWSELGPYTQPMKLITPLPRIVKKSFKWIATHWNHPS